MQFQKKEKRQTTVRFDSHHVRLRTGEVQRKTGSYMYRWTDKLGKRNTIYAATLEDLREQEEQILVDQHDGIKANIKNVTVNDVYYIKLYYRSGMQCTTVSVNDSLTRYRFGSIIFHRGKCFVSLRTISECGGIHEPKRNTSQSQTQSTRGI